MLELLIPVLGGVLDKIFPDKTKADEAKARLIELQMSGELQQVLSQLEINKEEAKNESLFVSGGRPACIWIGAAALGYASILEPVLRFLAQVAFGYSGGFPVIDSYVTMQVLFGLLGLGAMRSFDKKQS